MTGRTLALAVLGLSIQVGAAWAQLDPLAPWPTANRDLAHTSQAPFVGPDKTRVLWTFDAAGTIWGPVVGRDGTIYAPSDDTNLYALHRDGTLKWSFPLGGAPCQHAAIGADGTIYATGLHLFALTPEGKEKWHFEAPDLGKYQSPTVGPDGTIYQGALSGYLYAIDPVTGKEKWNHKFGARIQAPISFTLKGEPVIGLRLGNIPNVMKLDVTGNPVWTFTGPDEMRSATVGPDGTLYVACKVGRIYALDPDTGALKWSKEVRSPSTAILEFPALAAGGTVLQGSGNGELAAYSPAGDVLWTFQPDAYHLDPETGQGMSLHMGTPVVDATGALYVPSPEADFWQLDRDGHYVSSIPLPALFTRMAMGADGTLYCGSLGGQLYAFGDGLVVGDANGDGKLTVADVVVALRKVVGIVPTAPQDLRSLDVNASTGGGRPYGNGRLDVADAISMLYQCVGPRADWPYPQAVATPPAGN